MTSLPAARTATPQQIPALLGAVVDPQPVEKQPAEVGVERAPFRRGERLWGWGLAGAGLAVLATATVLHPSAARSAAAQDWPPFVLVAGLLLIGLVADDDGLFAAVGHRLARSAPSGIVRSAGSR